MIIGIVLLTASVVCFSTATPVRNQRQTPAACSGHNCNNCTYTEWSEWTVKSGDTFSVAKNVCASGEAYDEFRIRSSIEGGCNNETDTRRICVPDAVDRLIMALGLGGTGQDYTSTGTPEQSKPPAPPPGQPGPPAPPAPPPAKPRLPTANFQSSLPILSSKPIGHPLTPPPYFTFTFPPWSPPTHAPELQPNCPNSRAREQVCQHLTRRQWKRSTLKEKVSLRTRNNKLSSTDVNHDLHSGDHFVMQFSWEEHAHRFRRQIRSPDSCTSTDDTQHVLFVLDSSGSIGGPSYTRMKNAVAKLTPLFCRKVKFALMTFSSNLVLEFCFDCFKNDLDGRDKAADAIKAARYQSRATFTGEAARCICEELLDESCGIGEDPSCLDVVFITDGRSNGRRQICDEIKCLHRKEGINTFAIGINNFVQEELDCIADGSDRLSAFEFNSFDAFERAIDDVIDRLGTDDKGGTSQSPPQSCAALYGESPTTTQIPIDKDEGL